MQIISRLISSASRSTLISPRIAILAATVVLGSLGLQYSRMVADARAGRQFRAAMDALAELMEDRDRIARDLERNGRLIAAREARIADTKGLTADLGEQLPSSESAPINEDIVQFCQMTITEEEMNLAHARQRRARWVKEKMLIEAKIAAQQAAVRQMVMASSGN